MTHQIDPAFDASPRLGDRVTHLATTGLFAALVLVFLWFGGMKFTAYEAGAIRGLAENSPFTGWLYAVLSERGVSGLIGTVELIIAALLAVRAIKPELAVLGALGATATFVLTSSFFLSTPGVFIPDHGFLAISVVPGQFLLKDIVLLFASLLALGDALRASGR
ncbi:YkgB family protein [Roseovarius sp. C7]|uniref:YkgB family protein n=1 Tax=Roseovarius sp. C7 TaxID=3398643 RepID=UPI0039F6F440